MKSEALPIVHRSLVSALEGAEQELRSGQIVCSRDTVTSAIARVKEFSQIIQPRIGVIDEAGEVANAISHACYVCALIKTQLQSIEDDVREFQLTLETLQLAKEQNQQLTPGLQQHILDFYKQVEEYDRVLVKFTKRTMVRQLLSVSANAKKTSDMLEKHMPSHLMLNGSSTNRRNQRSAYELLVEREKQSLAFLNSPEIQEELSDVDMQKEVLATITSMGRRDEMQGKNAGGDTVIRGIKQKVWATSSAVVRSEIYNLPRCYVAENEIDMSDKTKLGFGGDPHVYPASREWLHTSSIHAVLALLWSIQDGVGVIRPEFVKMKDKESRATTVAANCAFDEDTHTIISVVNKENPHWMAFHIDKVRKVWYLYDPLASDQDERIAWLKKIVESDVESVLGHRLTYRTFTEVYQDNSNSCGIYCGIFLELKLHYQMWKPTSQRSSVFFRAR